MDKVAVVILNWNGKNHLQNFLPSVVKYSGGSDVCVYLADNGSTDDSVDFVTQSFPEVRIILLDKNYGFAGGYNRALKQVEAQYYVILNSDVEVTLNWLKPVIELMDSDNNIAAVQPKIKAYNNKTSFEYAGAAGGFVDHFGYPFCRGRILNVIEEDRGQYNDIREVMWATGACLYFRSDVFRELGGFDDDFFAHMEEIDLCWRAKNAGYKVMYCGASEIFHVGGGTLPNDNPRKLYLNFRNNLFLLVKNLPKGKFLTTLIARMILDGVAAFKFLFGGSFWGFWVVFKAHIHFYNKLPKYLRMRKSLELPSEFHKEVYQKSLVFNFFIKRKTHFQDYNL